MSKRADFYAEFVYMPLVVDVNRDPVLDVSGKEQYAVDDYPAGASSSLWIETETPLEVEATISGSVATVLIDKTDTDSIPKGKFWELIITYSDGKDLPMCNGKTIRADGA